MNFFQDRVHLKTSAKDKLSGKYSSAVAIILLTQLLQMAASEVTAFIPTSSTFGFVVNLLITFGLMAVIGVLELGLCLFFLSIACDQPFTANQLFYGFKEQPNKALCISAIFGLIQMICLVPGQLCAQLYLVTLNMQYIYRGLLLLSIGILVYIPISLMLSQSFYLMLDFPDTNARETLKYSMKIMKGHKKQLFALKFSFLPLLLLCVLTLGIGMLWLLPYMTMADTLFYLDLMHPSASTSDTH
jgi:uncharacterized membrane protein